MEKCCKKCKNTRWHNEIPCPVIGCFDYKYFDPIDQPFVQEHFSGLNVDEAEKLIGKKVEFSDQGIQWVTSILLRIQSGTAFRYLSENNRSYIYIRTTPETFKPEKPSILSALEMSWLQWKIMAMTGEGKKEVYEFLGGNPKSGRFYSCFLCDFTEHNGGISGCDRCLDWAGSNGTCTDSGSVFNTWKKNPTPENAQAVADFLHKKYIELSKEE